jgi:hypothetical protein
MSFSALLLAALWSAPVQVAPGPEAWVATPVPGWLESVEGHRLRMVRLQNGSGVEVPYRLLEPGTDPEAWLTANIRNRRETSSGHVMELLLPVGEVVDRVRLGLRGQEGVLEVSVEAFGVDGRRGALIQRARVGRLGDAEQTEIPLPNTDAPRLVVRTETVLAGLEPSWVELRRVPGWELEADTTPLAMAVRKEVAGENEDIFVLTPIGAVDRIHTVAFSVDAPAVFNRRVQVKGWIPGEGGWRSVGTGTLARLPMADGRPGIENLAVPIQPGAYSRIQVQAPRGSEASLRLSGAEARLARRWLLFPRPEDSEDLVLVRGDRIRSWSLEETAQRVDPEAAGRAWVGTRRAEAMPESETEGQCPAARFRLVNVLFVAAAVLLALLAWRVLADRSAR